MEITFEDKTESLHTVLVTISFLRDMTVHVTWKMINSEERESIMFITFFVDDGIRMRKNIDLLTVLRTVRQEFSMMRPSMLISYYDEECPEVVTINLEELRTTRINREVIRMNSIDYKIEDFIVEIDLLDY